MTSQKGKRKAIRQANRVRVEIEFVPVFDADERLVAAYCLILRAASRTEAEAGKEFGTDALKEESGDD